LAKLSVQFRTSRFRVERENGDFVFSSPRSAFSLSLSHSAFHSSCLSPWSDPAATFGVTENSSLGISQPRQDRRPTKRGLRRGHLELNLRPRSFRRPVSAECQKQNNCDAGFGSPAFLRLMTGPAAAPAADHMVAGGQGDQIARMFVFWSIVCIGQFVFNYKSRPKFLATFFVDKGM
jgi:hypothetical protein